MLTGLSNGLGKGVDTVLAESAGIVAYLCAQFDEQGLVALDDFLECGWSVGARHESDLKDGSNVVGLHVGQLHGDTIDGLREADIAIAQQLDALHLSAEIGRALAQTLESERTGCRPAHDGGIENVAFLHVAHVFRRVVVALVEALCTQGIGCIGHRTLAVGLPGTSAVDAD